MHINTCTHAHAHTLTLNTPISFSQSGAVLSGCFRETALPLRAISANKQVGAVCSGTPGTARTGTGSAAPRSLNPRQALSFHMINTVYKMLPFCCLPIGNVSNRRAGTQSECRMFLFRYHLNSLMTSLDHWGNDAQWCVKLRESNAIFWVDTYHGIFSF